METILHIFFFTNFLERKYMLEECIMYSSQLNGVFSHSAVMMLLVFEVFLNTIKRDALKYIFYGFGEGRVIVMIMDSF